MKGLWSAVCAAMLLGAACYVQAQQRQDMSVQEFHQVLVDMGSYLDSHKNTNLRQQFEALTDEQLEKVLPAVPDPRGLQKAVAALRRYDATHPRSMMTRSPLAAQGVQPSAVVGSCPPNTIIDNSPGAACTPAYPDPTNTAWQSLVNPLITFGAFSPTDYPDVAMQACSLTVASNLSIVSSALQGTVLAASAVCGALGAVVAGEQLAGAACWAVNAVFSIAAAVSFGLNNDCISQGGNVSSAEGDAAFHNTVTIYDALGTDAALITTDISNSATTLATDIAGVSTQLTNVNNQISAEFATLSAQLSAALTQLTNQLTNTTALLDAQLKQVMKENLTPDGQKILNQSILTCTGTNCPNVLASCQANGNCSWNNVGPLP